MPHDSLLGWGAAAFGAGLISFFSPCVAPLLPGYLGYLTTTRAGAGETVDASRVARPSRGAYLFIAGFSCAFVALGLLSGLAGSLVAGYQSVISTLAGIIMLIMGAFLLGLLPKQAMVTLMRDWRPRLDPLRTKQLGSVGGFVLGVVFAAGWTPCVGPMLAAILAVASVTGSTARAGLLLVIYSAGFAIPLLAIAYGWSGGSSLSKRIMRHYDLIARISGALLLIVGLIYIAGFATIFAVWAQRLASVFGL
jgi:cytochrome c-type biogenesis protein